MVELLGPVRVPAKGAQGAHRDMNIFLTVNESMFTFTDAPN